jgi:acylphosphatase
MATVRIEVFFSGNVQGVGFRFTALQASQGFGVLGTVQNLPDGRVKMVLEGEPGTIDEFILAVSETTSGNVSGTEINRSSATGEFSGFQVVH